MNYLNEQKILELDEIARQLRIDSIKMIYKRQAGHPGGSLSAAEIISVLFFHKLRLDPANPKWEDRDRFFLSKGHASAVLYAAMARRGFFPEEDLYNWGKLDCHLQGHPDRVKTPGIEMSAGPLGHGLAVGAGNAMAARKNKKGYSTIVLMGDGEMQAGIVWEAANVAAKYHLSNLTAILDYNDVQLDGPIHEIMPLEPLADRWKAFNWHVIEINGHNTRQVVEALDLAEEVHSQPTIIIAHTTKGKGVSFMENDYRWHGAVPKPDQYEQALAELSKEKV
ncbi:MAG: transketolase [Chloroflexi bacterium HGW-Chloroflexi-10]|nr:MAG: transketolase [Chloroflexi bacterium HGW-Chloroflexi-10]